MLQQRWGLHPHPSARLGPWGLPTFTPNLLAHPRPETEITFHPLPKTSLHPQRYESALAVSPSTSAAQGWPRGVFGCAVTLPTVLCAHLLDSVADFGGVPGVTVVGKHGVDDAVHSRVLGTQGVVVTEQGVMLGLDPASPALACSGLQVLPSAVAHTGLSCCPRSGWAGAGPPPHPPWEGTPTPALELLDGVGPSPTPHLPLDPVSRCPGLTGSLGTP